MNVACQCGAVTFKTPLHEPLALYICHCLDCRRQSASAFAASAIFPRFPLPPSHLLSCYRYDRSLLPSRVSLSVCHMPYIVTMYVFPQAAALTTFSCGSRPTSSGLALQCYFCKACGTRVLHSLPGQDVISVRGGCIEGLDWGNARHLWCKYAMVPIPESAEQSDAEPENIDLMYESKHDNDVKNQSGTSRPETVRPDNFDHAAIM